MIGSVDGSTIDGDDVRKRFLIPVFFLSADGSFRSHPERRERSQMRSIFSHSWLALFMDGQQPTMAAGATVNEPPCVLSFDYIDMCGIEWTRRVFTGPSWKKC